MPFPNSGASRSTRRSAWLEPDRARADRMIIAQEGEWALYVAARPSTVFFKAVRSRLNLSLGEIQALRDRLPGELRRGTRYEMERLMSELEPSADQGVLAVRRVQN